MADNFQKAIAARLDLARVLMNERGLPEDSAPVQRLVSEIQALQGASADAAQREREQYEADVRTAADGVVAGGWSEDTGGLTTDLYGQVIDHEGNIHGGGRPGDEDPYLREQTRYLHQSPADEQRATAHQNRFLAPVEAPPPEEKFEIQCGNPGCGKTQELGLLHATASFWEDNERGTEVRFPCSCGNVSHVSAHDLPEEFLHKALSEVEIQEEIFENCGLKKAK